MRCPIVLYSLKFDAIITNSLYAAQFQLLLEGSNSSFSSSWILSDWLKNKFPNVRAPLSKQIFNVKLIFFTTNTAVFYLASFGKGDKFRKRKIKIYFPNYKVSRLIYIDCFELLQIQFEITLIKVLLRLRKSLKFVLIWKSEEPTSEGPYFDGAQFSLRTL